jgi:S1-C subfamily serine protease
MGERGEVGPSGPAGTVGAAGEPGRSSVDVVNTLAGVAERSDAIVLVACELEEGTAFGTGTKTTAGTLITAQHVVEGSESCDLFEGNTLTPLGTSTLVTQQGLRDQVELSVSWTPAGDAITGIEPQRNVQPELGDFMVAVGHPAIPGGLLLERQYSVGFVTSTTLEYTFGTVPDWADSAEYWSEGWSSDAVAWHGNSGGPVFDAEGRWIGILVGGFNGDAENTGPDLTIVIPML